MPDNNQNNNSQNTNNQNNQNQQNNNQNSAGAVSQSKSVVLGCDSNDVNDSECQNTVKGILEQAGYQVEPLPIGPNDFADYSYGNGGKDPKGKIGVYLMAASLISFLDATDANFDFNVVGIRGDVTGWTNEEWKTKPIHKDPDGNYSHPRYDECNGKTYPELNEMFKGRCVAVPGENSQDLGNNILAAIQGQGFTGGGATSTVSSGGGAQIKDKTFEHCIRRICAATDSVFIVDNNVAILFPYVDWMAFTLRQKIDTIKKEEIDPDVFSIEYNNDGFYNKVSIAWGGMTLPDRFSDDQEKKKFEHNNFTEDDITKKMISSGFKVPKSLNVPTIESTLNTTTSNATTSNTTETKTTTKKKKTTQELSVDKDGTTILSEQYDALVEKYGELEKRVESKAPDFETAQYIVNALLIQYVRDFNNSCECRALTKKKYNGGTFHVVENPFTDEKEVFYLNGYNVRLQKTEPIYHDLYFKYGPESAEELADYQTFGGGGGAAATGNQPINAGSATEEQIWKGALVPCHQDSCGELRVEESDATDPQVAEDYYNKMVKTGKKFCLTCYGMSSWLYYQFNYKAGIPCQVVGNDQHHVIMLDRGNGMQSTMQDYRDHNLERGYRWREDQDTTVLLAAPNNVSSVGGNTAGTTGTTQNNKRNDTK